MDRGRALRRILRCLRLGVCVYAAYDITNLATLAWRLVISSTCGGAAVGAFLAVRAAQAS